MRWCFSLNHLHRNNNIVTTNEYQSDVIILSTENIEWKLDDERMTKYEIRVGIPVRAIFSLSSSFHDLENDTNLSTDSKRRGDRSIVEFREIVENVDPFFSPAIFIAPINSKSVRHAIPNRYKRTKNRTRQTSSTVLSLLASTTLRVVRREER